MKIKFGTAVQRDDSFLEAGRDLDVEVSPDRYNGDRFLKPVSNHVSLERMLRIGKGPKVVDFRRVGALQIQDDHSYQL